MRIVSYGWDEVATGICSQRYRSIFTQTCRIIRGSKYQTVLFKHRVFVDFRHTYFGISDARHCRYICSVALPTWIRSRIFQRLVWRRRLLTGASSLPKANRLQRHPCRGMAAHVVVTAMDSTVMCEVRLQAGAHFYRRCASQVSHLSRNLPLHIGAPRVLAGSQLGTYPCRLLLICHGKQHDIPETYSIRMCFLTAAIRVVGNSNDTLTPGWWWWTLNAAAHLYHGRRRQWAGVPRKARERSPPVNHCLPMIIYGMATFTSVPVLYRFLHPGSASRPHSPASAAWIGKYIWYCAPARWC